MIDVGGFDLSGGTFMLKYILHEPLWNYTVLFWLCQMLNNYFGIKHIGLIWICVDDFMESQMICSKT